MTKDFNAPRVATKMLSVEVAVIALFIIPAAIYAAATINKSINVNPNLQSGLVGYWTFDGGDLTQNAVDKSGQGNTGRLINMSTTTVAGKVGQALVFDGSNDYVTVGTNIAPTSAITMCTWILVHSWGTSGTSDQDTIVQSSTSDAGNFVFQFNNAHRDGGAHRDLEFKVNNVGFVYSGTGSVINLDKWNHVCSTYINGGTGYIYVNGVEVASGSMTNLDATSETVTLGAQSGGDTLDGVLDDLRIYSRALSAGDVKRLYQMGATTYVSVSPESGLATAGQVPGVNSGLLAHWTFDGADLLQNVADRSGQGNHGSLIAFAATSTAVVVGKLGQALSFEATNDYVSVPSLAINAASGFSVCAWAKFALFDGGYQSIWRDDGADFGIYIDNFNVIVARNNTNISSGITAVAGRWYHVCMTSETGTETIYVDGTLKNSAAPAVGDHSSTSKIGADNFNQDITGTIDDVRFYNRVLSAAEIKRIYEIGTTAKVAVTPDSGLAAPTQPSGLSNGLVGHWTFDGPHLLQNVTDMGSGGNTGRLINFTSTTTVRGKLGQALQFDGTDDYITMGSPASLDLSEATIAFWYKLNSLPGATSRYLVDKNASGLNTGDLHIGYGRLDTSGRLQVNWTTPTEFQIFEDSVSLANVWKHVTVLCGTGGMIMYINGIQQADTDASTGCLTNTNPDFILGSQRGADNFFDGVLDDVRIYNRRLSPEEIRRLYQLGL